MPDDPTPYAGAIEETAKTAGKALDLVKEASEPIGQVYGLLIGDTIRSARQRRLDAITRETKKILKGRDLKETAEVAEQIALPLLEAAQGEPRKELQDLWARLLANAMDPSRQDDVRPEFIGTLKILQPLDAMVLGKMGEPDSGGFIPDNLGANLKVRVSSVEVALDTLVTQRCIMRNAANGQFYITGFGREFILACRP